MTRYTPPPVPPRMPAKASGAPDLYEQAARASWIAPLLAIVVGMCVTAGPKNGGVAIVRLVLDIIMIFGGVALGIFALTGVRKRGPERVLAPAIVGLIINGLIIAFTVAFIASGGLQRISRARDTVAVQQAAERSFRKAGWFGAVRHQGALITATSLVPDASMGPVFAPGSGKVGCIVLIAIENSQGVSAMDVDCSSVTVHLSSGQEIKAMSLDDVPPGDSDFSQAVKRFSGKRQVAAGARLTDGLAYLAPRPDLANADAITIEVDGSPVEIGGRLYTESEKSELLKKGGR